MSRLDLHAERRTDRYREGVSRTKRYREIHPVFVAEWIFFVPVKEATMMIIMERVSKTDRYREKY